MYERSRKICFALLKILVMYLVNWPNGFLLTRLSIYDFSTLYATSPHNLIKEKFIDLIEHAFKQFYKNEGTLYLACNDKRAFITSLDHIGPEVINVLI